MEIVVLDNTSVDGSATAISREFPEVRVIASDENFGFAGGNNEAVLESRGRWLVLLNPDTVVLRNGLEHLIEFCKSRERPTLAGGRSYNSDHTLNPTTCWGEPTLWSVFCAAVGLSAVFRKNTFFDPESLGSWKRDSVRPVPIVAGCLIAVKRAVWDKLGGFDRDFFMYGEDADLSLRARDLGVECVICPDAEFFHYAGASERVPADKMVCLFSGKMRLYRNHWLQYKATSAARFFAVHCLVRYGLNTVFGLVVASRRSLSKEWLKAFGRSAEWFDPQAKEQANYTVFMAAKCVRRVIRRPFLLSGLGLGWGYLKSFLTRARRVDDPALIKYIRQQQMQRLRKRPSLWADAVGNLRLA